MSDLNCPNCGSQCPVALKAAKVVTCPACSTTLFLRGAHIENAGEQGIMHDAPMLFGIGDNVELGSKTIQIVGHARFSYGRGFWDEFCGLPTTGETIWISVDEGDVILQNPVTGPAQPKFRPPFKPGETLEFDGTTYTVTEVEQAECVALRGQFDEELHAGETYDFVNASADGYALLSGEFWGKEAAWYTGRWHDPFGVQVVRPT